MDHVLAGLTAYFKRSATPPPVGPGAAEQAVLELFHSTAASVPAYQDFLRRHGVDPGKVATIADFRRLPLMTKEDYHGPYPLADRCRGGRVDFSDMIAVSSGSTGRPSYWPRSVLDELRLTARFEQIFHDSFGADRRSTLAVVCFPLGTWVGGLYTAACCRNVAAKGYPLTVVAPGNDKEEILRVVPELAPSFEQTVLLGYPPFLKDVVDTGMARGVDWPSMDVKMVMAGEVFSEDWRDLVAARTGMRRPAYDTASLYGTADAGVLGNETPLSIGVRRFLAGAPAAAQELFGESRLPTLVQYDPRSRFFETRDGTLLFSGDGAVPLVRYHIADQGGVIGYREMLDFCAARGFDPLAETGDAPELPFVYVFGRSHFTVSFFGANVFPENVTVGLEQPEVSGWTTGKFVLEVVEDDDRNRRLRVTVELAPGESPGPTRERRAADSIRTQLRRLNSEFAHYVPEEHQTPQIVLLPTGDPAYFPRGVKHRYTRASPPPEPPVPS
ncbi:phenylacetate--CoA ligase family protein [Sphaerisporangium sp. TRM90804]|uniref:phenylacetate--CoA ligase family protein n=1 Tax=Sphaerisporangium sp. TRM90804 TaxID=3031113 RepID=UPI0024487549|nr:phenylacetate--CoA ligase family protein [Sphaerisporangium sp. TRM90804]MDH2428140.1 phenylacetate--CoA ligase family protein [Sphaerisporangium sp. TRM90804]